MAPAHSGQPELTNVVAFLADRLGESPAAIFLRTWENLIFSVFAVLLIALAAYAASRKTALIPGRRQGACELFAGSVDDFVCGIIGPRGREHTPFIGTLFIYILFMNLIGLVPFMKSSTSSLSTTFALALCVFIYVQYSAVKNLGLLKYADHLMGRPRGLIAWSVVIPLLMFFVHIIAELIKPISLSLRLRSNIWGDDMLLAILAGFGIKGLPLLFFGNLLVIIASIVQAAVFSLLALIYLALFLAEEH